jgi:iron complex outermembrane receptor protein
MFHNQLSFMFFLSSKLSAGSIWRKALLIFFHLLFFIPCFLPAQTDTVRTNALDEDQQIQTVVIQATRAGSEAPVPHVNVKAADIQRVYHAQDIPFILASTPSLVESSDAGTGIGYTAMRIRGTDPSRINVTINGIPFNDAESQAVFWVNLPDLASSASEIQVQRGVGTSTNGAGAFGATVNIDLSQVNPDPYAEVSGTIGSFNTKKYTLKAGTGLMDGKFALSGRLSRVESDGFIDRASADLNAFHLTGAYIGDKQSLQLHVLSGQEVTYQAWYGVPAQYINDDALRTFNVAGTQRPGEPYDSEVDDYQQQHYMLNYNRILSPYLQLQLNGHYTRGQGFFEQYMADQRFSDYGVPPGTSADTTDLIRRLWLDNHFYGGTFALKWTPAVNPPNMARSPEFLLGGAASHYLGKHFGEVIWAEFAETLPKDFRYYENDADKYDANIYLKTDLHFRNDLSAFIDLQYRGVWYEFLGFDLEQNNVTQDATLHFFNPKVGLNWQLHPQAQAYIFAGVGNREPNRLDFTQSTPASRPKAERLYDFEGGVRWGGARWNAAANLFYMYYQDQLVLNGQLNEVGFAIRTNVPDSYRAGIELEGNGQLTDRLTLTGNLALSRNRIREFTEFRDNWDTGGQDVFVWKDTPIAYSPDVVGGASLEYAFIQNAQHRLSTSLSGKYVGKQYLDNTGNENTILEDYAYGDLRLNYDWTAPRTGQQLSLIFTVVNVFDAQYSNNGWTYRFTSQGFDETPFNPYTRAEGNGVYNQTGFFPQAGRHVMATVRWRI